MLSILLTILKILGIILLVIIGIIVLFLLILCIPIRYRAKGHKEEDVGVEATVSFLLHLIHAKITYDGNDAIVNVKILGITVYPKKEKPKKKKKKKSKKAKKAKKVKKPESEKTKADMPDKPERESNETGEKASEYIEPVTKAEAVAKEKTVTSKELSDDLDIDDFDIDDFSSDDLEQSKRRRNRKSEEDEKATLSERWDRFANKLRNIYNKYNEFKAILNDKRFKHTVKVLKKKVVQLFKHTFPRKLRGYVEFGFEDPSITGYITAVLGAVYGMYGRSFNISPDFENKKFNLKGSMKGHVRFMTLILLVLNVILRPDCRYTYRMIKKAIGNEEGEE